MGRYLLGSLVLLATGFAAAAEPELHIVAVYDGHDAPRDRSHPGKASVLVDRPGKEVVLVVSAYESVNWEVRATVKTALKKVIVAGYYQQQAAAPKGVVVEDQTRDGTKTGVRRTYIYGPHEIERARFRPFVRKLHDHTGLEVASFQSVYRPSPEKPFVVDAIQKDERLSSDFPKLTPAAQVAKFKFEGTRFVQNGEKGEMSLFGQFTQEGPSKEPMPTLPKGIIQVTYDPAAKDYYGITGHQLHLVDMKKSTSDQFLPPANIDPNWLRSLTCDTKRDRIVISGRNATYEFSTKNGEWATLGGRPKGSFEGLVWQKSTDTLFAIGEERGGSEKPVPTLYELNATGGVAKKTALGSPMFPGVMGGGRGLDGRVQLVDLGADLAVLVHHRPRDLDTGALGKSEAFLYVINPKSGKVQLAWKE